MDQIRLLDLLREAGHEPVTLDELGVAGVRDPARALLELELAGHAVQRVHEAQRPGRTVECVRLAPPEAQPAQAREAEVDRPPTLAAVLGGLVTVAVLARLVTRGPRPPA